MYTYTNPDDFISKIPLALTQGTFDGLHLGHRIILEQLKKEAAERGLQTAVLTFFPHPRMVIDQEAHKIKLLDNIDEKIAHFQQAGIDHLFIFPFTGAFSELSPEAYISNILIRKLNVKLLVVGYDHRFGKNREGDISLLKNKTIAPFEVKEIQAQLLDEIAISSTKIRKALNEGNISLANKYLGYFYKISGSVVHGNNAGKSIGFPTANVQVKEDYKLIPSDGVYAVKITVENKMLDGAVNIGNQPTFEGRKHAIEVHIFDFDEDIYGKNISVHFVERIRGEKKFESLDALVLQIKNDVEEVKKCLNKL